MFDQRVNDQRVNVLENGIKYIDPLNVYWVSLRIPLNEIKRSIHSQDEFRAKSRYPFLVSVLGCRTQLYHG
jgi:hypothetical protein